MKGYAAALWLVIALIGWGQVQEHAIAPLQADLHEVSATLDCSYPGSGCP